MSAKRNKRAARRGAGRVVEALPALSSLEGVPSVRELRCPDVCHAAYGEAKARLAQARDLDAEELRLGCVVRLDRGFPAIACDEGVMRAEHAVQISAREAAKPAVGDWCVVRVPASHEKAVIEEVLPRASELARWRGGNRGERQTLAANVDVVMVAAAVSARGVSLDRIARSAVVARDGGCEVAVVLTKSDRAEGGARGVEAVRAQVREVLGEGVPVVATCRAGSGAIEGAGEVARLVGHGRVGVLLGESGAGKSTLLNALLGTEALETGAVRERDDMGRHTTVTRRMVSLGGDGVLIDAPGLRSLPLVGHERGLAKVFPLINEAAHGCRFRDCTHTREPGCAVREALAGGAFPEARLEAYLALAKEMRESAGTLDPDVVI